MKLHSRKEKRGASILLLSFFFMTVLFLLAASLYRLIPAELHAASRSHEDTRAHYVARAGIQETMTWLQHQIQEFDDNQIEPNLPDYNDGTTSSPNYPRINEFLATTGGTTIFDDGEWDYVLEIEPIQDNLSLSHTFQPRFYSVRSTARLNGRPVKKIDVLLKQKTFASFSFFSAKTDSSSRFIFDGTTKLYGPVHTNEYWRFEASTSVLDNPSSKPYFGGVVSNADDFTGNPYDGNEWLSGKPYDGSGEILSRYEASFAGGREGVRKKNDIPLPQSTVAALREAWPDSSTQPSSKGVYIHPHDSKTGTNGQPLVDGGIFVQGDIDRVRMQLDESGNQRMFFVDDGVKTGTETYEKTVWKPDKSKPKVQKTVKDGCKTWVNPTGGTGTGLSGGSLKGYCAEWNYKTIWDWQYYKTTETKTRDIKDDFSWEIVEAVEADHTYTDYDGKTQTLKKGQTLMIKRVGDDFNNSSTMAIQDPADIIVMDGQINGTIYVNGNVGNENNTEEGIWGIVKGSAQTDENGALVLDSSSEVQYQNKALVTPFGKSVNLGGDLLQFSQDKFDAAGGPTGRDWSNRGSNRLNERDISLDPTFKDRDGDGDLEPELSPNNYHVMGIISQDVWMKGPKGNNWRNGGDGYNDVYAVILAGTESDSGTVSGGFGTYQNERDKVGDGLGKYRVIGGIIQGRTDANPGRSNTSHYWTTAGVGYDLQTYYDKEATRNRFFPTFPEFKIIRYLESSARNR